MFGSLTKLAEKSFILGFLLPALVGVIALVAMNQDIAPFSNLIQATLHDKSLGDVTVLLLGVWMAAVLLMVGNHWAYRLLEGYTWPLKGQNSLELKRRKRQLAKVRAAWESMTTASAAADIEGDAKLHTGSRKVVHQREDEYLRLRRLSFIEYSDEASQVLSTRFGNVIRAFEKYPGTVYGVESIHMWPRLLGVVPKDYQAIISDARAPVDFFVSLVVLSMVLGMVALFRVTLLFSQHAERGASLRFILFAVLAFFAARICYGAAVASAKIWGEVVKSTFDLYLPELAKKLGFSLPDTLEKRRIFWQELNSQFQFQEPIHPETWTKPSAASASEAHKTGSTNESSGDDVCESDKSAAVAPEATSETDAHSAPQLCRDDDARTGSSK